MTIVLFKLLVKVYIETRSNQRGF